MQRMIRTFVVLVVGALVAASLLPGRPVHAQPVTITVTNTNTSGAGSLRQAMLDANATPGTDRVTIRFNIPANQGTSLGAYTYWTIAPDSNTNRLPALTRGNITIDGSLTLGNGTIVPTIVLSGNALPGGEGILIKSSNNVIRGLIINGFSEDFASNEPRGVGIVFSGYTTTPPTDNVIEYCYIGTSADGTAPVPNRRAGIMLIHGASRNTVRNNVISGNNSSSGAGAVYLGRNPVLDPNSDTASIQNNVLRDNLIGVNATGTAALPNASHGVYLTDNATGNTVGPGNVISGNGDGSSTNVQDYGVWIDGVRTVSNGNVVKGNLIGTNQAGTAKIPNANGGIRISKAANTTIGGPNAADRNVISGNDRTGSGFSAFGIVVDNREAAAGVSNIVIQNNLIGLAQNGTDALPNRTGVLLECGATGVALGPNNVISGNTVEGVRFTNTCTLISGSRTVSGNQVKGNRIGITEAGAARPNFNGVYILDSATNNTIGGASDADRNVISGNTNNGVLISGSGTNNNRVERNQVANNGSDGILVQDSAVNNRITRTTTTGNGGINTNIFGIRLANGGNLAGQANRPALNLGSIAVTPGNPPRISGNVANCGSGCTVEVFSSTDGEGNEGPFFVTAIPNVTSNFSNISIAGCKPYLTFTLTDNAGNTSQFTNPPQGPFTSACSPTFGVTFTPNRTGSPVTPPAAVVYRHTLTNTGNGQDTFTLTGSSATSGVTFSYAPASPITLDAGQSVEVSVTVNIPASATLSPVVSTVRATSQGDPTKQASVTQTTPLVQNAPVPQLTPASASKSGLPGAAVTYEHELKNIGGGSGSFSLAVSGLPSGWSGSVAPNAVTLAANASQTVVVTVNIPAGANAGATAKATLTATAAGGTATAEDTTTVLASAGLTFTPVAPQNQNAGPGQQIDYRYTLTNTGNGQDTFTISVNAPAGWTSSIQPGASVTLARGASQTITVRLTVPQGTAPSPPTYATTVTATSNSNSSVNASVTNVTTVVGAAVPQLSSAAPQSTNPGSAVTFSHTITNVGNSGGTFNLAVINLPPGWGSVTPSPASVTLNPGNNAPVSVTVTPPAGALAGAYTFTLRATATDANGATAAVQDTINVNPVANLALSPTPQSRTEPPGTVVTYTFTLANNGNFTDTVDLSLSSSQGWSARTVPPSPVQVAAGQSRPIQVVLTIPPGIAAGTDDTTTLTATSAQGQQRTAQAITTIAAVPGVTLAPEQLTRSGFATRPVTFTYTLLNSGSTTESYSLAVTDGPADWVVSLTPSEVVDFTPGQTATVELVLQAPAGTPNGITEFTLEATSSPGGASNTALARLRVGPPIDLLFTPDRSSVQLPGALVGYTHIITNVGVVSETFVLSATSSLGWETFVSPVSVALEPDASTTVTVTVLVPPTAAAQNQDATPIVDTTVVTARSITEPGIQAQVVDETTVLQSSGVSFSPNDSRLLIPGQEVIFQHLLVNTGNGFDSFVITATQDRNWTITIEPTTTPTLRRGGPFPVEVRVQVPADAQPTDVNRIRVRATSAYDPNVYAEVVDTIGPGIRGVVFTSSLYLPVIRQ